LSAKPEELCTHITDYLEMGGLFNPELANHDAVRDLLIDCRAALVAAEESLARSRHAHDQTVIHMEQEIQRSIVPYVIAKEQAEARASTVREMAAKVCESENTDAKAKYKLAELDGVVCNPVGAAPPADTPTPLIGDDEIDLIAAILDDGTYTKQERKDFNQLCNQSKLANRLSAARQEAEKDKSRLDFFQKHIERASETLGVKCGVYVNADDGTLQIGELEKWYSTDIREAIDAAIKKGRDVKNENQRVFPRID